MSTVMDIVRILATVLVATAKISPRLTTRRVQNKAELRVYQGDNDVTNKYPYVVVLQPYQMCTACLITPVWVLTAQHCIVSRPNPSHIQYGNLSIPLDVTDFKSEVIRKVEHPRQYGIHTTDMGLLLVRPEVRMDRYGAVSAVDYLTLVGLSVEFVGGGYMVITDGSSGKKKKKHMPVGGQPLKIGHGVVSACSPENLVQGFICVSPRCSLRQFVLPGDSGGPLFLDNKIIGIVKGSTTPITMTVIQNYSDRVFTPTSPHQEWIHHVINSKLN